MWWLIIDGVKVARHSTRIACIVEAFERRLVWRCGVDAPYEIAGRNFLHDNVEIVRE